jgi:enamine deaminase RidA (YjgF/YER057c/UK114 family)
MDRTAVNPWPWSVERGFNQAELLRGHTRELIMSGQCAMSADGLPQHPGDMRAQIIMAMDNIERLLGDAGMALQDVVRLNIYTTDVDLFFAHCGPMYERLAAAGIKPASTLLEITRLAFPDLLVELEATAVS